jgi:arylsulfatase A-like enzyme
MRRYTPALLLVFAGCRAQGDSARSVLGAPVRSPNLLLIIADDFGLDAASFDPASPCYAVGDVSNDGPMPNVAELCRTGVRFTAAWAMAQCSPARASMLTGRLPFRTGLGDTVSIPDGDSLRIDEFTLPRALAAAGSPYAAASIGKWHVTPDPADANMFGWPHHVGPIGGSLLDYDAWTRVEDGVYSKANTYATTAQADDAISWLDGVDVGTPWLLWLAVSAPHDPYHLPPLHLHDADALGDFPTDGDVDPRPWFAAMATALDTELGRVFDAVRARGEWEETVVVFVGDNASDKPVVEAPFSSDRAKGTLYQGGIAVPMVIAGARVADAPRDVDTVVSVVDVYATLLELAGVDVAATVEAAAAPGTVIDSVSLVPYLVDPLARPQRTEVFAQKFAYGAPIDNMAHAVRNERYKLICERERVEMYDLLVDPWEERDLFRRGPAQGYAAEFASLYNALTAKVRVPGLCGVDRS